MYLVQGGSNIEIGRIHIAADVLAAWGQVGGAIATFAAVVVAIVISMRDGRAREEERRDSQARHARLIVPKRVAGGQRFGVTNWSEGIAIDVAIVDLEAFSSDRTLKATSWAFDGFEPGLAVGFLGHISPGETLVTPKVEFHWPENQSPPGDPWYTVTLEYMDFEGRVWRRRSVGQPERIYPKDAGVRRGARFTRLTERDLMDGRTES